MKTTLHYLTLIIALFGTTSLGHAQYEDFQIQVATVDATSGETLSFSPAVSELRGLAFLGRLTTYDQLNARFITQGDDGSYNRDIYIFDAATGELADKYSLASVPDYDITFGLVHSANLDQIFMIQYKDDEQMAYLTTFDSTGSLQDVAALEEIGIVGFFDLFDIWTSVNEKSNALYLTIKGQMFDIDLTSGTVRNQFQFPVLEEYDDNIIETQFDNATSTMYGLHWDSSEETEYLVTIDTLDGTFAKVNSLPGVNFILSLDNSDTFDEEEGEFIFVGARSDFQTRLYSIESSTGNILSEPIFPVGLSDMENITKLNFDQSSNTLYGLYSGPGVTTSTKEAIKDDPTVQVYPNPFVEELQINFGRDVRQGRVTLFSSNGQTAWDGFVENTDQYTIRPNHLNSGVYYLLLNLDDQVSHKSVVLGN